MFKRFNSWRKEYKKYLELKDKQAELISEADELNQDISFKIDRNSKKVLELDGEKDTLNIEREIIKTELRDLRENRDKIRQAIENEVEQTRKWGEDEKKELRNKLEGDIEKLREDFKNIELDAIKESNKRIDETGKRCRDKIDDILTNTELRKKELELVNARIVEELNRTKITEERIITTQKEIEAKLYETDLKLKTVEASGSPEGLFAHCLNKAIGIAWNLNKKVTDNLLQQIHDEVSEREKNRYDRALKDFLATFNFTDNVMDAKSILKAFHTLQEQKMIAERQGDKVAIANTTNKINVIKDLGIIK